MSGTVKCIIAIMMMLTLITCIIGMALIPASAAAQGSVLALAESGCGSVISMFPGELIVVFGAFAFTGIISVINIKRDK